MKIVNKTRKSIRVEGNYLNPNEALEIKNQSLIKILHVDNFIGAGTCEIIVELNKVKFYNHGNLVATEISERESPIEEKIIEIHCI